MECRPGCGACCIALSISSPIPGTPGGPGTPAVPGLPGGKPAGVRCPQLDADNRCRLHGRPEKPPVCSALKPSEEMCGTSFGEALAWLAALEEATRPGNGRPGNGPPEGEPGGRPAAAPRRR